MADTYSKVFNDHCNSLSQEVLVLVKNSARQLIRRGMTREYAEEVVCEALETALDAINEEGLPIAGPGGEND